MAFTAEAVANRFLWLARRDHKAITPLKMQKLVYFAHGWHLAIFGKPLISEPIQAWQYGPVISSLYQQFKRYGASPIRERARILTQDGFTPAKLSWEGNPEDVKNARAVIDKVWAEYGQFTASRLTTLTHSTDAPWSKVPGKNKPETPIPNQLIKEYFLEQAPA